MSKRIKIAINGFGRVGRPALRIALEHPEVEVVAVNSRSDAKTLAHLLQYDTVFGTFSKKVGTKGQAFFIEGKTIPIISESDPAKLPWKKLGAEVILECTGVFRNYNDASKHLKAGAKKVIISAPAKDKKIKTYLLGVNEKDYQGEAIISMGSCTTNCIAPIMKVMCKKFGVAKSFLTTIHSYTTDQRLLDNKHKDLRRARSAACNMVPTSTGAASATAKVIPVLKDHFDGMCVRVPTPNVSMSDIVMVTEKNVTIAKVNQALKDAAKSKDLKGILGVTSKPLVSSDFVGDPHSGIVDLELTNVVDKNLVKIVAWYDNEWAYSKRLVEMVSLVA